MVAFLDPLYASLILQCQIKKVKIMFFQNYDSILIFLECCIWLMVSHFEILVTFSWRCKSKLLWVERWARGICKSCNGNGTIAPFARNYVGICTPGPCITLLLFLWKSCVIQICVIANIFGVHGSLHLCLYCSSVKFVMQGVGVHISV